MERGETYFLKLKKITQRDVPPQRCKRYGNYLGGYKNIQDDNHPARDRERVMSHGKYKYDQAHKQPDTDENEIDGEKERCHTRESLLSVSAIFFMGKRRYFLLAKRERNVLRGS